MRPDHVLSVARRKLNRPTAVMASWEALGPLDTPDGLRVELADDSETWSNRATVLIDIREEDEEKARFERESGKCHVCGGDGQEWRGWNRETGHRWRPCKRCGATGAAPEPPR